MNKELFPMLLQSRWAMLPEAFQSLIKFADNAVNTPELAALAQGKRTEPKARRYDMQGSTAIIPITGPIFCHENILNLLFGGTALSTLASDFESAMQDRAVDKVVLYFDSPGGEVTGISEMAQRIFTARKQKKVIAYVYGMACSAAYWLASASSKIVLADTAQVGSIGVVAGYVDTRKRDEAAGLQRISIVSSQSPRKNPDLATDAGRAEIQKIVDSLADVFVKAVADYRGTTAKNVIKTYGQGSISIGVDAVKCGMAEEVSTLDGVLSGKPGTFANRQHNASPAAITTLEQLQEIVGASSGLISAAHVYKEPVIDRRELEGEEEQTAITGIVAAACSSQEQLDTSLSDEERKRRHLFRLRR